MQFVFPSFLWFLLLLAVPVLIHLFYFRRYEKVLFTNVHFLKELVEETSVRNKLKNILILLCRLFALAALILAFAQPFRKSELLSKNKINSLSLYIDNSYSMDANSEDGSLLQKAKRSAREIILAYSDNDRFQILTNDFEGKHLRMVSKQEALNLLEEISSGPVVQDLSRILAKQKQSLTNAQLDHGELYVLSDFQKINFNPDTTKFDSQFQIKLVPIQSIQENNLSIDSVFLNSPILIPGQINKLVFKLRNYGTADVENIRSSVFLNGQEYPGPTTSVKANDISYDTIPINILKEGWQKICIKIKDYPIQFDDQYFLVSETSAKINILVIYDSGIPGPLIDALQSVPFFNVISLPIQQIDYSKFSNQKLIVLADLKNISSGLAQELNKALHEGTQAFIFPAADLSPTAYAALNSIIGLPGIFDFNTAKKEGGSLNMDSEVFRDVFVKLNNSFKLPASFGHYQFGQNRAFENLIAFRDGSPMINRYKFENAYVYYSASPLNPDYNELSKSAELFIPLLYKASINSILKQTLAYEIHDNPVVNWPSNKILRKEDLSFVLSGPEEFIPAYRITGNKIGLELYDQLKKAGIYDLKNKNEILGSLAFNDSRKESDPKFLSPEELTNFFGRQASILNASSEQVLRSEISLQKAGVPLWWWCLLAAVLFIFAESLLIRYWKTS